jgi:hypothetical protein
VGEVVDSRLLEEVAEAKLLEEVAEAKLLGDVAVFVRTRLGLLLRL